MQHLGTDGYKEIVSDLLSTTQYLRRGIEAIEGLEIVGNPIGPLLALQSHSLDLFAVADVMDEKGWHLNRNVSPQGLHLMLSPAHRDVMDELLKDLAFAVENHGESKGVAARYA
jgi:glutamate/tyrosine decarboxylase-like PLP-dependent enzyme